MTKPASDTLTMTIAELEKRLPDLVGEIARQDVRVVVEDGGIPVVAIVSISDLRRLTHLDESDREAREVVEAMRAAFADVPAEEIERQTERIMAEIREEDRRVGERITRSA